MYPALRLAAELRRHRAAPPLAIGEAHVSHHRIQPQDIDPWRELNNGRVMTLFDLGRVVLFRRLGAEPVMRARRWGGTIAGSSVRYRRRMRAFERIEMRSRLLGWDARFLYAEQSMWRGGEATAHALLRVAVTSRAGLVPMPEVEAAMDLGPSPALPAWVRAWAEADALRPWPPMEG